MRRKRSVFLFSIKLTKDDRGSKVNLLFIYPCLASNFVKRIHKRADGILKKKISAFPEALCMKFRPRKKRPYQMPFPAFSISSTKPKHMCQMSTKSVPMKILYPSHDTQHSSIYAPIEMLNRFITSLVVVAGRGQTSNYICNLQPKSSTLTQHALQRQFSVIPMCCNASFQ